MTRAEIEAMDSYGVGRALLVEFGWRLEVGVRCNPWRGPNGEACGRNMPHVIMGSADAMLRHVAPAMRKRGWKLECEHGEVAWYCPATYRWEIQECNGYNWPAAACRAALLALQPAATAAMGGE